jgi:GNAT superfamily N-acetyltransferase
MSKAIEILDSLTTGQAYVSWEVTSDDIYDDEGDVVGRDDYILIEKVYVASEFRGCGVGAELVRRALKEIEEAKTGLDVKLAALPDVDGMEMGDLVAWYERFGFSVDESVADCHAVIMTL